MSTYPIAIEQSTLGPKVPLVIFPISLLSPLKILVSPLAITLVSGFIPTLNFLTPYSIWLLIILEPG